MHKTNSFILKIDSTIEEANTKLINFIENFFGVKSKYNFKKNNTEVKKTWADISKAKKLLNYNPKTQFDEGMKLFLEWYVEFKEKDNQP